MPLTEKDLATQIGFLALNMWSLTKERDEALAQVKALTPLPPADPAK